MGAVRGVLLDESLLFFDAGSGNFYLPPGSMTLLRRLQYSKLRVGFCYQKDVLQQKEIFLKQTAASYSFDCISLRGSHARNSFNESLPDWHADGEICFYVTSRKDETLFGKLQNRGWKIVCIGVERGGTMDKELLFIDQLEELLITVCSFSKKVMHCMPVLIVGYVMKPSREEDFAKRGAFPMYPTQNGLLFVPLTFELPLAPQIQEVDVILHKATDEILSIDPDYCLDFPKGIAFSRGMQELERSIQDHPNCCIIDPLNNIYPLLDRHKIQQILLGLQDLNVNDQCRLRAPQFLKVGNLHEPSLRDRLLEANLSFPLIVKPQIACGVADAHNMALVFRFEDFMDLPVPLPAILQEYVDHGSLIFKFYVLGDKVFHAVKKSMPNASFLLSASEKRGSAPIMFNSLKSLPVATEDQVSAGGLKAAKQSLDVELVNKAAKWLRNQLGLTIFGFDVVIQEVSGDHVIVDLNYLPTFKEVPDSDAVPAFWDAIKSTYDLRKAN
ncbi:inositol-tetrakisphosphate 1-kinase 6 isoform X2 [Phoenix dactylifera]|uniref:Inositol-tetrakisphosphate 1-kinase 6 n=1 Tax=Phoenix dactylifera TaxID=42345 RepID=A0A8B9AVA0_PHODC|nr:inositol-tetrakisphosphate 1-kinase 6 isoform X2 [Phoenix dactylifera]